MHQNEVSFCINFFLFCASETTHEASNERELDLDDSSFKLQAEGVVKSSRSEKHSNIKQHHFTGNFHRHSKQYLRYNYAKMTLISIIVVFFASQIAPIFAGIHLKCCKETQEHL